MKKAALAVAVLSALATNARATTTKGPIPFSGTVSSSCLSEPVAFSGVGSFVSTTQQNSDKTFTASFTFHFAARGIGLLTGSPYTVTVIEGNTLTVRAFAGVSSSFLQTFGVQGKGGHMLLHITGHLTINNNGTITVNFNNFTTKC